MYLVRSSLATVLIVGAGMASLHAQASRELFPHTKDLGRAAAEFEDDVVHVVAAYYYSQRNHESRWLLIELAVTSPEPMRIRRSDVSLLTPAGQVVPVASQRSFAQDRQRTRLLYRNAITTRHPVVNYLNVRRFLPFRWFALTPTDGTVTDSFDADEYRAALGDLYFASPTGAWEPGTYSLVVEGPDGNRAMIPIDLE